MQNKRRTIVDIRAQKNAIPIVALTAYTTPSARLLDAHVDVLLVGDSLGMVLYGMESTLPVTLDMMIAHGKAVMRGSSHALVVVDMPFGSYQASPVRAFESAARVMAEVGCGAIKLEGGEEMAPTIEFLTRRAVPVMAHIGLMPQHVNSMGGYRYQGRTQEESAYITRSAKAVEAAGAFAVVLEGVEESLAREITSQLSIPTIGIGASPACDGQVLVSEDMAGLNASVPRFVKTFGTLAITLEDAAKAYAEKQGISYTIVPAAETAGYDVRDVIAEGTRRARTVAEETMAQVRRLVGLGGLGGNA